MKGTVVKLSGRGHEEIAHWDTSDPKSVREAHVAISDYMRMGYAVFDTSSEGEGGGGDAKPFNPLQWPPLDAPHGTPLEIEETEITVVPPMAGG